MKISQHNALTYIEYIPYNIFTGRTHTWKALK